MELLGKLSLWIHILAGLLTLLAGPVAIFYNFKNINRHKQAGKLFFYAMVVVCFTSWVGYFKRPDVVFFQFLLGIATIVLASVIQGIRAIQLMKGKSVIRFDFVYNVCLGLFGAWMLHKAYVHFSAGTFIAFPILFFVFGISAVKNSIAQICMLLHADQLAPMVWYKLHVATMLGAFTASTTAFTVNAAHFLPWYIQWFGPTLALLPLQFYFAKKISGSGRKAKPAEELQTT